MSVEIKASWSENWDPIFALPIEAPKGYDEQWADYLAGQNAKKATDLGSSALKAQEAVNTPLEQQELQN